MVHKLVWQHFGDGRVPDGKKYLVLNHKDETPRNNRIDNLELMSSHKNIAAGWKHVKKDGLPTGVFHTVNKKKFIAKIMHNRRSVYLGTFDKAEHGSFAYQGALKVIEMNQEKQCECPKYAFECSECEEGACTWRDRI